jgi:16S rRNA (guanine966-N2)-methyltransferase
VSLRISSGKFRGRVLFAPQNKETRPSLASLRSAVFNICQQSIEGALFLDLFAGSGAMGLEALSRGAQKTYFIERNFAAIQCIKKNIELLEVETQAEILKGEAYSALEEAAKRGLEFDIIYMDPPYSLKDQEDNPLITKCIEIIEKQNLLREGGVLFIEEASYKKESHAMKKLLLKDRRKMGNCQLFRYMHG